MFPAAQRVKKSIPTALTSGSANGSSISGLSALVATARAAATIVAVAPTLVARSHASLLVRGIGILSARPAIYSLRSPPLVGSIVLCPNRGECHAHFVGDPY
ncbi:Uncharacterised protein [Mycobacterium tuberculosis]|nr:Uncharacterised protein [Mycobacterium tuberculosis]